jgi:Fe2+ or Zn2+ uptake regulation protein
MKTTEERLAWSLDVCRQMQLRMTPVRQAILWFLALHRTPTSLETIEHADGVRGHCNATTVYRTLMLFKEAALVRLIGTPRKVSYFVLNVPEESNHFLICQQCGQMAELPALQVLTALDKQVMEQKGYVAVYHELEVYGICPTCRTKSPAGATTPPYSQRGMTVKIGAKMANQKSVW